MSCKVIVGEKEYYDDEWYSNIYWKISCSHHKINFGSRVHDTDREQDNIEQYVDMLTAIENKTKAFITIGGHNFEGEPYGVLIKSANGNYSVNFDECDLYIDIGKILNDKAIFEDIVKKLL